MKKFCLYLIFSLYIISCKGPKPVQPVPLPAINPPVDTTGTVNIQLSNVVNGDPLILSTSTYTNANNDEFKVNMYKYYFTNIVLETATGFRWTQPESYYLVDQSNSSSLKLIITGVPRANYTKIEFKIGVDGSRNTSGAQTGALDPAKGMFWTWSSGYIMAKMEGTSPQSSDPGKKVVLHLGGFTGTYSSVRNFSFTFPNTANVTETHSSTINMKNDLAEWFKTPNTISFNSTNNLMSVDAESKKIADNYADMFTLTSVVN
jgi:hypothetical protein